MTPQIYRSDLVSDLEPPHAMCSAIGGSSSLRDAGRRQPMSLNQVIREANITWHGVRLNDPDWRPSSHSIAFTAWSARDGVLLHVILNAFWEPLVFELPKAPGGSPLHRWIDAFLDSPDEITDWMQAPLVADATYRAEARSVVVLIAGLELRRPAGMDAALAPV